MAPTKSQEHAQTKRAGRACLSCRARKIRCNFEECGSPCSNCLNDDLDCLTTKSRRGKKPYRRLNKHPKSPGINNSTTLSTESVHMGPRAQGNASALNQVPLTHTAGWLDDSIIAQQSVEVPKDFGAQLDHNLLHQELSYASIVDKHGVHPWTTAELTPRSQSTAAPASLSADIVRTNPDYLPDFIRPLSLGLTEDDINYLRVKGALDVPSLDFIKALLTAFVQFVHPMSPVLDLSCCSQILNGEPACIGLLQMHAIAFASIPFVGMGDIQKAGFTNRRDCRKAFYNSARLLFDLDAETDKLAIVQAVLLVSHWGENPGDNKGVYYWTGIAVTLLQTLGLHRRGEYKTQSQKSKLLKRVWWSCYVRDRMLGLAIGRPLRIRDTELDTPSLTLQDFDIMDSSNDPNTIFPSVEDQILLAKIFMNLVEVWKLSGKVLCLHFSVLQAEHNTSTAKGDDGSSATMLFLKSTPPEKVLVQLYDDQLQALYNALPPFCAYSLLGGQRDASPCVVVSVGYFHIVFWSVVSALHRPQLRAWDKANSLKRVEEAAVEVSRIDRELHESGLDRYLPPTAAIPLQFTAFIIHTKRLEHKKIDDVAEVLESLFFCIKVLETGRDSFPGGDAGGDFMQLVAFVGNVTLLFDSQSKLWGVEYRGVHVCPGSRQVSRDANHATNGFETPLPPTVPLDTTFTGHVQTSEVVEATESIDHQVFSFDDVDAVNWDILADFMPGCSMDYDHAFSTMVDMNY